MVTPLTDSTQHNIISSFWNCESWELWFVIAVAWFLTVSQWDKGNVRRYKLIRYLYSRSWNRVNEDITVCRVRKVFEEEEMPIRFL